MERMVSFMQNAYFLGGASPEGFVSDFPAQQKERYGFLLKGGPGTGKSTLMKTVAAVFADEAVSVYHCASDPRSLDAVVLEDRGVYLADATAPHEMSVALPYVTGELVDMAAGLHPDVLAQKRESIVSMANENAALHAECRTVLSAMASMQSISMRIGEDALLRPKLDAFAQRLVKRLLPKGMRNQRKDAGKVTYRQCSALTPLGNVLLLPENYGIVLLCDDYGCGAQTLIANFAERLSVAGMDCVLSRCLTMRGKPGVHLLLPECRLALLSASLLEELPAEPLMQINLHRFYDAEVLRKQRSVHRFAMKNADLLQKRASALLADALAVHDALEKPFIEAQNREKLEAITADVCCAIRERFPLTV